MNIGHFVDAVGGSTMTRALRGDIRRAHVRARAVLVIAGMTLFTIGFVVTIDSLPRGSALLGSSAGSATTQPSSALLVVGFVASLVGLCLATIAPAVMFVRARKAKI
jgi:hypothetical protein